MNGMTGTSAQASVVSRAPLFDDADAALFPKLTEAQLQLLLPLGEVRPVKAGQVLYRPEDIPSYDATVVLEGSVSIVAGSGEEGRELVLMRPGDPIAELNVFTGQGRISTGIVREAGSGLAVPQAEVRSRLGRQPAFRELMLQTPVP